MQRVIDPVARRQLADSLGDSPVNAIFIDALLNSDGLALVDCTRGVAPTVLISTAHNPSEPMAFGTDASAVWALLQQVPQWSCVEVHPSIAEDIAGRMRLALRCEVKLIEDVFMELRTPPAAVNGLTARLLTPGDEELYARSAPHYGDRPETARKHVRKGPIGVVVRDDRVVCAVEAVQRTDRYANLGAETLPAFRDKGYCIAAASVVASAVQAMNLIPLWSASVDNPASLRVADKLGFVEVDRRVYVVPQRGASRV